MNNLVCVLYCGDAFLDCRHCHAVISMRTIGDPSEPGVIFDIMGFKLPPGLLGFHVHEKGNLLRGCETLGPHYNPTGTMHGRLNNPQAHRGDLGNLYVNDHGDCKQEIKSRLLSLNELLGRSLVIHSERDDLGQGGNEESLKTGNSGARFCCGVIGYA